MLYRLQFFLFYFYLFLFILYYYVLSNDNAIEFQEYFNYGKLIKPEYFEIEEER